MKAIETVYNGYRFRSRLEARWAVFFDACGIKYQYEPEGFMMSDGTMYLPDFYLPDIKTWFECKGVMTETDNRKIEAFVSESNMPVAVGYPDLSFQSPMLNGDGTSYGIDSKENSMIGRCYECGTLYFVSEGGSYACPCCGHYDGNCSFDWKAAGDDPLDSRTPVVDAFQKARQARFEHGEKP